MLQVTKEYSFSKVGINEVKGLKATLSKLMEPVREHLLESIYWNDLKPTESEYQSRDGFIPYGHNCGGLELTVIIPKCEGYNFDFLEFGEYSEREEGMTDNEYDSARDSEEGDGHLDAKLRIWLKFEGYDSETGELKFWFYAGGGNGDAPYFRNQYEADLFEESFTVKSLAGLQRKGAAVIKRLIQSLK